MFEVGHKPLGRGEDNGFTAETYRPKDQGVALEPDWLDETASATSWLSVTETLHSCVFSSEKWADDSTSLKGTSQNLGHWDPHPFSLSVPPL